jgi:hypothetical protein
VLLGVLGAGAAACTAPRNALGTNSSPCFRALAVAKDAVGESARFAGVRYISAHDFLAAVRRDDHSGTVPPLAVRSTRDAVCAVNYRGEFSAATVSHGWPAGRSGHYAVVAVNAKTNKLLGTLVLNHPPLQFSKILN